MIAADTVPTPRPARTAVSEPPVVAAPSPPRRFTLDGDAALERHLADACIRILAGVRGLVPASKLEAVLLGGGYGRGEGGVLYGATGDRPYHDLEFYVAIAGHPHLNELRYRRRLDVLGEILSPLADVEVRLTVTSLAELAAQPVTMFSYDLFAGHRLLAGRPPLPGARRHACSDDIPPDEATRLLMNRCSGLLFARTELEHDPLPAAAADFVRRNIAKMQLACGDAVLAAFGRYHWSCRERHRRLEFLVACEPWPWLADVLLHHAAGVEFKLHPTPAELPRDALIAQYRAVVALALQCWLCLEARRLERAFPSARAYAEDVGDQCPDSPLFRNVLLNLRADGFRFHTTPRPWRHPRQRVFRALALLLWEPATFTDPGLRACLERTLHAPAATLDEALPAYRALWRRVG